MRKRPPNSPNACAVANTLHATLIEALEIGNTLKKFAAHTLSVSPQLCEFLNPCLLTGGGDTFGVRVINLSKSEYKRISSLLDAGKVPYNSGADYLTISIAAPDAIDKLIAIAAVKQFEALHMGEKPNAESHADQKEIEDLRANTEKSLLTSKSALAR